MAVNRGDAAYVGHLLKYDSVHGRAPFTVEWDDENMYVDYVHSPYSSVMDALETRVNGRMTKVLAWYDNEWGYCCRLVDVTEMML